MDIADLTGYGWLIIYLVAINFFALALFALDKAKARKRKRRISERSLFFVAIIGGSLGAIVGMKLCHHKTKHNSFRFGLPLVLLMHLALALIIYWLYYII